MRESDLHAAVVQFLALALPREAVYHHSPNAARRTRREIAEIKSHGMRTGWPDLEIVYRGGVYFIELKAPNKHVSPEQAQCHRELRCAGARVGVARSLVEVSLLLASWGFPLSAQVAA